jgi:glycine oxidase
MPRHVVIVGSGVIGLATARALARAGSRVTVIDAGGAGRDASLAAAGILGAGSEHGVDSPLFRLSLDALRSWPETVEALGRESRRPIGYGSEGTLLLAFDDAETDALDARRGVHRAAGLSSRLLTGPEARALAPRLTSRAVAALHIPEARLDNRALHAAYEIACARLGVESRAGRSVTGLVERAERVQGVRIGDETLTADAVVVAAGAWSESLARTTGVALPSRPIKGQLVRVEARDGEIAHVVKRGLAYAVPRAGEGLILGTTSEDAGFDRSEDEAVTRGVLAAAEELIPGLGSRRVLETWVGFRPRLEDGLPAIGPVTGLFLATGHFRNGILLADITGVLVARAVAGDGDPRLAAFSPDRFAHGTRVRPEPPA